MDNKELVEIINNEVVTTSKQVAEVFGKEHKMVMRDIRNLVEMLNDSENSTGTNLHPLEKFIKDSYKDKKGENRPMYIMNRDAFTLLVMGYTTKNALKFKRMYIQAFNLMEQQLKNQVATPSYQIDDPIKRAERWIEEEKERQRLAEDNKKQKQVNFEQRLTLELQEPKVSYYDSVLNSDKLVNTSIIAKDYGMSAVTLNKLLNKLKVQYKRGGVWLLYAKYQDKGYTQTTTTANGFVNTKWTQKGRVFLYNLLKKHHYLPLIEQN